MKATNAPAPQKELVNPVDLILSAKREVNRANADIHASLGQTEGAETIWCLERAIVELNRLHQWHIENSVDIEF